jgi:putative membrane protein
MILNTEQKKQLEARIAAAEKATSGEIVVRIVKSSGGYAWIPWAYAASGTLVASMAIGICSAYDWSFSAMQLLEWQIVGACSGILLSLWGPSRRLLVSKNVRAAKVHRQSLAHFVAAGISETRDRTGILVYVSEFERRVEILADKGIHVLLGEGYWKDQVEGIVKGVAQRKAGEALCRAVDEMGAKLAAHFPARADDQNELSNSVQSED